MVGLSRWVTGLAGVAGAAEAVAVAAGLDDVGVEGESVHDSGGEPGSVNAALDDVHRRVQQETLGHRGRKDDPLFQNSRVLRRVSDDRWVCC